MSWHRCQVCGCLHPGRVAADLGIDWWCHRLVWRGFFLPRWKWKLALRLNRIVGWLIRLPEERTQS